MIKNKELLVNQIYKQLDCKEEQTKEIIKHFLSDIQLFDKKQGDYGPHNISKPSTHPFLLVQRHTHHTHSLQNLITTSLKTY